MMKALFASCLLLIIGCQQTYAQQDENTEVRSDPKTVFVHLFEWKWIDVERECPLLAEAGYSAVQVSPPQESIPKSNWWSRYQPISYQIKGRSGDETAFRSMINACRAVGVDIYVDAVINHMAAQNRVYPAVPYSYQDFHLCRVPIDYSDRWKIQNCDLNGLNDLATGTEYVRARIAEYLNRLVDMGVAGFRIDAAKHIDARDIENIVSRISPDVYVFQEVIGAVQEPVTVFEYEAAGDVTEFLFGTTVGQHFKGRSQLKELRYLSFFDGWLPSDKAVVFTDNHDTQRYEPFGVMTYKDDGARYALANVFMLAYPYGYPKVMSSYRFSTFDQGPPTTGVNEGEGCFGRWVCEHRWPAIANMVEFRNVTSSAFQIDHWWDNGANQIAFARGNLGYVVMNGDNFVLDERLFTGMPEGLYCNVISGKRNAERNACEGDTVTVDDAGFIEVPVQPMSALAIHRDSRLTTAGSTN